MGRTKYLVLSLCLMILILTACNLTPKSETSEDSMNDIDQTDQVKISFFEDQETLKTISTDKEIKDFVNNLEIENWEVSKQPSNSSKDLVYDMYRQETVKLFHSGDRKMIEAGNITTYKDIPYIELNLKGFSFTFEVPQHVADYLSQLPHDS